MQATTQQPLTVAPLVSFSRLFGLDLDGLAIDRVVIPLIQRDYAQGRSTASVRRVRDSFIDTLCHALLPGAVPVDLDFIFGDVYDGSFQPLDGQQRLTTLFLLHCYLAWQCSVPGHEQKWSQFSYETRASAREFCKFLARRRPDLSNAPSAWISDDAAYLPTWDFDPTIQAMLTMLDALHEKFRALGIGDFRPLYDRLVDEHSAPIRFHVLPVKGNGLTDTLYIKMNARGKPLTPFENFKAHFESVLREAGHAQAGQFALKVDTDWTNILWPYRGSDNVIDDEFLRYFRCITEINAWNAGIAFPAAIRIDDLAEQVYGAGAPGGAESVAYMYAAFDAWHGKDVAALFDGILCRPKEDAHGRIPLFNAFAVEGVNLFNACCRHHDTRAWSLAHTVLLHGILVHLLEPVGQTDFITRLRTLRNLVEASGDEIRAGERMTRMLAEVRSLIQKGDLDNLGTFNQAQVADEKAKAALLCESPELQACLHALEDHPLLRGGLTAFDLDARRFTARAEAFQQLFSTAQQGDSYPYQALTGALLAQGDYARRDLRASGYERLDFGSSKNTEPWQDQFRGRKRETASPLRPALAAVLDATSAGTSLQTMIDSYVTGLEVIKDWRYYFVKYPEMRKGASGRYVVSPQGGYQACMLNKDRLTSNYFDPYLRALAAESGLTKEQIADSGWPYFTGDEKKARVLVLRNSNIGFQSVPRGWAVSAPPELDLMALLGAACPGIKVEHAETGWLLVIPQSDAGIDTVDRIEVASVAVRALVTAGC